MRLLRVVLGALLLVLIATIQSQSALHVVDILGGTTNGSFSPPNIEINEDDQIRWENNGSATHNSRSTTAVWSSPNLSVGGMYTRTFSSPGTFPYACTLHDFAGQVVVVPVLGILDEPTHGSDLPNLIALRQNSPNPFNAATQIEYSLATDGYARLVVYNILGQTVATLADGFQTSGTHTALWDGRDAHGREVSSGIYFARMATDGALMTRKMVLLR